MFLDHLINRLHDSIYHHDVAINYLHSRKVTDEEIKEFKMGYSRAISIIDDGSDDYKLFASETYKGHKFENKIIFPIYDMLGNSIGILGRAVDSKEFKFYLTKDGKISGAMFGFYQALPRIYETKKVFTVEGPFDFLAFRKVYPNTVATLTAELTESQHELLNLYADQILTVFDSDKAGMAARDRAVEKWPDIKYVDIGYKDPDSGLKYLGLDGFKRFITKKVESKALLK